MRGRLVLALCCVFVLLVLTTVLTLAHADLDKSEPADGATVSPSPAVVHAYFTEEVTPAGTSLKVVNATGQQVDNNDSKVDPTNRQLATVSLKPNLPPGKYTVQWHTTAAEDNGEEEGTFSFTVAAAAPAQQPTAAATAPAAPTAAAPAATTAPAATVAATARPAATATAAVPTQLPTTGGSGSASAWLYAALGLLLVGVGAWVRGRKPA